MLLDEACDQPNFTNWDSAVSCGEYPLVIYETLEDYFYDCNDDNISPQLKKTLENIIACNNWDESTIGNLTDLVNVFFKDGKSRLIDLSFENSEDIACFVSDANEYGENEFIEKIIEYENIQGAEMFLNTRNISMLDLPLLKIENSILQMHKQFEQDC